MVLICVNWPITCWLTEEHPKAAVGLVTCLDFNVVSVDSMLISILCMSVEALEMLCAVVAKALVSRAWDLKPDNLLRPLHLMCDLSDPIDLYPILMFCHLLWGLSRL